MNREGIKKQRESDNKDRHIQQLQDPKARRRGEPVLTRRTAKMKIKPAFLIVCEGKNTEPSYFNQFRLTSATIKAVGKGFNTTAVVKQAKQLAKKDTYDQVWVVFDRDLHSLQNFNNAIKMAEKFGFGVAYSNQAFEYWLILHFNDHQGSKLHRSRYNDLINEYLKPYNISYDGQGSKRITPEFFNLMQDIDPLTRKSRQSLAIKRARKIQDNLTTKNFAIAESSTTVFRLIEEITQYL